MNIWEECRGNFHTNISAAAWRIVEAQHILSSRDLVDTIEEHALLEDLLEESKPLIDKNCHYLIFTPFRYPPLDYGSRFGRVYEPSLWYGSLDLTTAFAEVSYYRLQFFQDSCAHLGYVETPLTAFQAFVKTKRGIDLTEAPFQQYRDKISNKNSYEYSQPLGTAMREANTEACIFYSARTQNVAKNIAVYTSKIFIKNKGQYINNQQNWLCMTSRDQIEFTRFELLKKEQISFSIQDFV